MLLLSSGCVTQSVVKVPVACIKQAPAKPVWPMDALPADASEAELIRALFGDWKVRRAYVPELETLVGACAHDN